LPDFVKKANLQDLIPSEHFTKEAGSRIYADPVTGSFPCHSKEATVVSYLYFLDQEQTLPKHKRDLIEANFQKFGRYWGVHITMNKLREAHQTFQTPVEKLAEHLSDDNFALITQDEKGNKRRFVLIHNAPAVRKAAAWFHQNVEKLREKFAFPQRHEIASKILERANALGAHIEEEHEETLKKYAGVGTSTPLQIAEQIRRRIKVAKKIDPDVRQVMEKTAQLIEKKSIMALDPDTRINIATTLENFDRTYGLLNKYSELVPAPEDVVFGIDIEKLGQFRGQMCTLVTGSTYDKDDFRKLPLDAIKEAFGPEIARDVTGGINEVDPEKMGELAETLPRPDAEVFEQIASKAGVQPIFKDAQAIGWTHADWLRIAAMRPAP
jgi:hypothetical protein